MSQPVHAQSCTAEAWFLKQHVHMPCFPIASFATSGIVVHKNWIAHRVLRSARVAFQWRKSRMHSKQGDSLLATSGFGARKYYLYMTTVHDVLRSESIRITSRCIPFLAPAPLLWSECTAVEMGDVTLSLLQFGDPLRNGDPNATHSSSAMITESFLMNKQLLTESDTFRLPMALDLLDVWTALMWARSVYSPQQLALCRAAPHTQPSSAQKAR
jgi:hypothetical protein